MVQPLIGITGRSEKAVRPPNIPLAAAAVEYVRAVERCGGAPVVIPPHLAQPAVEPLLRRLDGLILSGGGDLSPDLFGEEDSGLLWQVDEARDQTEIELARLALASGTPTLAICRGIQVVNVAAGGSLIQDISTEVPDALPHTTLAGRPVPVIAHAVQVEPDTRLADIVGAGELPVNSAHHQAVKDVGRGLTITARAPDGVIEGIEAAEHPFYVGVQWHPEVMTDTPHMRRLFERLIEAAGAD